MIANQELTAAGAVILENSAVALSLRGHRFWIAGRTPVVPSRFGSRYVYGHVVEDGRHHIVSAGLGTSMVPIRLGTRPEVELVLGTAPSSSQRG